MRYPLAKEGVFWSIQGEGHLRGFQQLFIRLGGCPVACPECDTDYAVASRATVEEIVGLAEAATPPRQRDRWAWVTGGEPGAFDLGPLLAGLRSAGFSTAVATSGYRRIIPPVDWLSVSPHSADPGMFAQRYGSEIKLVVGLNSLDPWQWIEAWPDEVTDFMYRYVQPVWRDGREDPAAMDMCLRFLREHSNWALSRQDHKLWGVP